MDMSNLRWVLIIAGIAIIGGIFLFALLCITGIKKTDDTGGSVVGLLKKKLLIRSDMLL